MGTKIVFPLLALLILSACAAAPVRKEVGEINFTYQPGPKQSSTDVAIAIVSPQFVTEKRGAPTEGANFAAMLGQSNQFSFNSTFQQSYEQRLASALRDGIIEIVSNKGFPITGPFASFDDMTFSEKKEAFCASVPTMALHIDDKVLENKCDGAGTCVIKGVLQVAGDLNYRIVEPLTEQTIINRRINLSDLAISKEYTRIVKVTSQNVDPLTQMVTQGITNAMSGGGGNEMVDNSDKALVDALNEFYVAAMTRIDKFISREELLSQREDIELLKSSKRF